MTDETQLTPLEEDEALAAELALGLLDGDEARDAVARLSSDAGFAQSVRDWQERLAGLADRLTPVMAPARARQRIRETLGHGTAPLSQPASGPARAWWRGPFGALLGLVAVAAVAAFLWLPGQLPTTPTTPAPDYQAQLVTEDQAVRVAARLAGSEMEIALEQGAVSEGRDYEIWWIRPDGSAPISIGLVPHSGSARMTLPASLDPSEGIRIALSDEPAGGSPTGQATGPVVAIADLTRL
ncbi:anti-sigma factor [Paracoccus spongiarum]|uniref:Anti-sigma factor n=1 Tax=Paracoccus spongiarum TaxID=3064387 RepID=A0ABT9JCY0_9RHOB|nr:anti-sigma factor [Paracoccus sp. 2205BS29-5]MDP5307686.1 anti-sigma factor [Paracoccus sp. 2205BS29-5]